MTQDRDALAATIDNFLTTIPHDLGCAAAWQLIHAYAEAVAEGERPETRFPGISAHLAACPPCADDFAGLQNALMTAEKYVGRLD